MYKHDDNGEPILLNFDDVPDYYIKTGDNTRYMIHPEEILADNFVFLVQGTQPAKSEWVIEGMRQVLNKNVNKL